MYILNKILSRLILSLFLFSISYADECYDNININENFFNEDILGYYLSAIDFETGQSDVLLFDLSIDFSDAISNICCGSNLDNNCSLSCETCCAANNSCTSSNHGIDKLYVDFKIEIFVPEFQSFSEGLTTIAEGTVLLNNISSTTQEITFRNTDLSFDTQVLQDGATFSLIGNSNSVLAIDDTEIDNMTETFLSLGRIPNGTYSFSFSLKDNNQEEISGASYNKTIDIFLPTYINLLSPGSSSISDSSLTSIPINNPIFQWDADYCSNCNLSIRVSEYKPNQHTSLAEAIEDYSSLPIESGYFAIDSNINMFQYPSSDVGPLENGKLYVWQLKRTYGTTSGVVEELSDLFVFKIESIEQQEDFQLSTDENLYNLKLLIGEEKYNELFGPNGDLNSYNSLHPLITVNGEQMSITYLIELIDKLNNDTMNIIEVEVE